MPWTTTVSFFLKKLLLKRCRSSIGPMHPWPWIRWSRTTSLSVRISGTLCNRRSETNLAAKAISWIGWRFNTDKTLQEAVLQWQALEDRKKDSEFRREIADHNMLAQYVRDFLEDNQGRTLKDALQCWKVKRRQPNQNGFVVYAVKDFDFDGVGSWPEFLSISF